MTYGYRKGQAVNPIYNKTMTADRYGISLAAFLPLKWGEKKRWSFFSSVELFSEDTNIDFYDSQFSSLMVGLVYRVNRP